MDNKDIKKKSVSCPNCGAPDFKNYKICPYCGTVNTDDKRNLIKTKEDSVKLNKTTPPEVKRLRNIFIIVSVSVFALFIIIYFIAHSYVVMKIPNLAKAKSFDKFPDGFKIFFQIILFSFITLEIIFLTTFLLLRKKILKSHNLK